jgi:hypothetical protein
MSSRSFRSRGRRVIGRKLVTSGSLVGLLKVIRYPLCIISIGWLLINISFIKVHRRSRNKGCSVYLRSSGGRRSGPGAFPLESWVRAVLISVSRIG